MTVRRLLAEHRFQLRLVAGEAGLDRPVRWAHSTELLDPRPYLRGREIVLTVGAALTNPRRCEAFVRAVSASQASAIGYGIGDVLPAAPGPLRDACDRLGLPLLEVPQEVPFLTFTEWLADCLADERREEYERQEVGRLLDLVCHGLASPDAIRDRLQQVGLTEGSLLAIAVPATATRVLVDRGAAGIWGELGHWAWGVVADESTALAVAAHAATPCGIGSRGPRSHLSRSLAESRRALEIAIKRGTIVRSTELSTFSGLLVQLSDQQLAAFIDHLAAPLADHDAKHSTRLFETLRMFLSAGGSRAATARALFLHPNSLRHRLSRIKEVTGRDPVVFEDRIALAVAVHAWDDRAHLGRP